MSGDGPSPGPCLPPMVTHLELGPRREPVEGLEHPHHRLGRLETSHIELDPITAGASLESSEELIGGKAGERGGLAHREVCAAAVIDAYRLQRLHDTRDRKSTRLNSSHLVISYAVFCLKKKKIK